MFTKNWYNGLQCAILGGNQTFDIYTYHGVKYSAGRSDAYCLGGWINFDNTNYGGNGQFISLTQLASVSSNSNAGVIFGDGTAEPTLDDYKLSGNVINISGMTSRSLTVESIADGFNLIATYTISNTRNSDITISEIGIVAAYNAGTSYSYKCLLEHTLLDTPVTISAGEIGRVIYTITVPNPYTT